jgi:hypothetical protein
MEKQSRETCSFVATHFFSSPAGCLTTLSVSQIALHRMVQLINNESEASSLIEVLS